MLTVLIGGSGDWREVTCKRAGKGTLVLLDRIERDGEVGHCEWGVMGAFSGRMFLQMESSCAGMAVFFLYGRLQGEQVTGLARDQ